MQWHYTVEGLQKGPVEEHLLRSMIASGEIGQEDYVWNETMGDQWKRVADAEELRGDLAEARVGQERYGQGLTPNRELMAMARLSLAGSWGTVIAAYLIYFAISTALSLLPFVGEFVDWIISGPFEVGVMIVILNVARSKHAAASQVFSGFETFATAMVAYILMGVITLIGFILFIVPGVIASLAFAMTYFVIADRPLIGPWQAIKESVAIMRDCKMKLLLLQLRFLGWGLLCTVPALIGYAVFVSEGVAYGLVLLLSLLGLLWLLPYMAMATAKFYEDVRPSYRRVGVDRDSGAGGQDDAVAAE